MGASTRARQRIACDEKRRAEEHRRGQHEPMIGADDEPDEVRDDDADETDGTADRDGGARRERRRHEGHALRALHIDPARAGGFVAEAQEVQRTREPGETAEGDGDERRRATTGLPGDVEVAHEPAERAERLWKSLMYCTTGSARRRRRSAYAREEHHRRRHSAMPHAGQRVDNGDGQRRAEETRRRHAADRPGQTRAAIRDYQASVGLIPDGFATATILARLRGR